MTRRDDRTEVADFLRHTRTRLRTRVFWGTGLAFAVPVLPLLMAATALPKVLGLVWGVGIAALLVTLAWRAQKLPGDSDAARWLDAKLKARGLFVAAEHCVALGLETDQARNVLADAANQLVTLGQGRGPSLPWIPLMTRAGLAAGLAVTVFVILLTLPLGPRSRLGPEAPGPSVTVPTAAEAAQQTVESRLDPQTAELLRNHPQLAKVAEQALASGDMEGLKDMLEQTQANGAAQPQSEPAPAPEQASPQPKPSPPENDQKGNQPPTQQPVSGSNQGGNAPPQPGSKGNQSQQAEQGKDPSNSSGSQTKDQKGSAQAPPTDEPSASGKGTGTGHSDNKQGDLENKLAGKSQVKSADPFAASLFEIKLPGQNSKMSLQQALAATSRSAESALQTSTAPLEYESAVRDYFLTLSHKEQP